MKKVNVFYWVFTGLIFLLDGVLPALTFNSQLARQSVAHLGYPDYFLIMLTCYKVAGALVLILPMFKGTVKQWAYAGFALNFVSAAISATVVDGIGHAGFALFALAVLAASYYCYNRRNKRMAAYDAGPELYSPASVGRAGEQLISQ